MIKRFQSEKSIRCVSIALAIVVCSDVSGWQDVTLADDSANESGVVVSVQHDGQQWQLIRNGQPYYVNGAGGPGPLAALAAAGGNSGRTWGVDETTRNRLDEAHENGLSMAVGIWLEHERHGFDYNDYDEVIKQVDLTLEHVRNLKDHPAILVWGIGNEMEGEGDNPAIWSHIESLASRVKKIDPHHPVMTVIAEIGGNKVQAIHKLCPSVDIIGINSYGGGPTLPQRYHEAGGTKPYIVTEFGPVGTWEVPKNDFGAISEPDSATKAKMYRDAWRAFKKDSRLCLGSYAFIWGDKQEATATWFGMLLPDGKRTAAVDVMSKLWTERDPENRCPEIKAMELLGSDQVAGGEKVKIRLTTRDAENDSLKVHWVVMKEADSYVTGGDFQEKPSEVPDALVSSKNNGAIFQMPAEKGIYRIYACVEDDQHNNAATANVPVLVK